MASSVRSLVLLCLVVASLAAAAEASRKLSASKESPLKVTVDTALSVVAKVNGGTAVTCKGGKVTVLPLVKVHVSAGVIVYVTLKFPGQPSGTLDLELLVEELLFTVDGLLEAVLKLVANLESNTIDVLLDGKLVKTLKMVFNEAGELVGVLVNGVLVKLVQGLVGGLLGELLGH